MKSNGWRTILPSVVCTCAILLAETAGAQSRDWDPEARRLEGSWTVQVTQVNCNTGAALGSPFLSLLTFASGGALVETTSNPMFFPAVRGPGHGTWSHEDRRLFKAVSVAFITVNGALVKTQTISQSIEMGDDPNEFKTTAASVEIVPADGGPTITGCATAYGKRIE